MVSFSVGGIIEEGFVYGGIINPLGPKRGYIRTRRTTIGRYIRTLTMNAPLTGYQVAMPTRAT